MSASSLHRESTDSLIQHEIQNCNRRIQECMYVGVRENLRIVFLGLWKTVACSHLVVPSYVLFLARTFYFIFNELYTKSCSMLKLLSTLNPTHGQ